MLKTRIGTAFLLLLLLSSALFFFNAFYFKGLLLGFIVLAAWEWSGLIKHTKKGDRLLYSILVVSGVYFAQYVPLLVLLCLAFFFWCWAAFALCCYAKSTHAAGWGGSTVPAMAGFCFLVALWWSVVYLRWSAPEAGILRTALALVCIFITDIGAYFIGKAWGRKRLILSVSPNKTWLGFSGGIGCAVLVAIGCAWVVHLPVKKAFFLCGLVLLASVFSVVGDLTVSLLKRFSGVKDTGRLFPGHGGVLDRVDSLSSGLLIFALGIFFSDM